MERIAAVILAAGNGKRMKTSVPKQFLELSGIPVFLHSVRIFDRVADKIVLVASQEAIEYCSELLGREALSSEIRVISGGSERYLSSMAGVAEASDCDLIMIHDAARACVSMEVLADSLARARRYGSGIAAVALKDTVKMASPEGRVLSTPDRSNMRIIQTPQTFRASVILEAYQRLREQLESRGPESLEGITDDAMVVERFTDYPVYLSQGSYENIKLTTPEDLTAAVSILRKRQEGIADSEKKT